MTKAELQVQQPMTVTDILAQVVMSDTPDKVGAMERIIAMQRQMQQDEAERQFNDAMNRCQLEMGRISANMTNPQTHSKYADYAQIDRAIRPIYTKEGFSLSFGDGDSPAPDMVRIICYVSRGGHTRVYRKDMPIVTKGPKGNDVMTATHATGSADAYAKRYLVKDIFNLAIGEDDDDGNGGVTNEQGQEFVKHIQDAGTAEAAMIEWKKAIEFAESLKPMDYRAMKIFTDARDLRLVELKAAKKAEGTA